MSDNHSRHHATLFLGALEDAEARLSAYAAELGIKLQGNPDFFAFREEVFGIDDARRLKLLAGLKAVSETGGKIFFISSPRLTPEAQNALLKTFEEPGIGAQFFLIAKEVAMIVPTLLSRVEVVRLKPSMPTVRTEGEKFLAFSVKDRLSYAREFADKEKNLSNFLDELLLVLRNREGALGAVKKTHKLALTAGAVPGASRLVLEHLALVL